MPQFRPYCNQAKPPITSASRRLVIPLQFLIFQAAGQSTSAEPAKIVQVRSYLRKDGRLVQAYTRAALGMGTAPRSTAARRAFQATTLPVKGWPYRGVSWIRCRPCRALGLRRNRCA
jgi:hypothetical protein